MIFASSLDISFKLFKFTLNCFVKLFVSIEKVIIFIPSDVHYFEIFYVILLTPVWLVIKGRVDSFTFHYSVLISFPPNLKLLTCESLPFLLHFFFLFSLACLFRKILGSLRCKRCVPDSSSSSLQLTDSTFSIHLIIYTQRCLCRACTGSLVRISFCCFFDEFYQSYC